MGARIDLHRRFRFRPCGACSLFYKKPQKLFKKLLTRAKGRAIISGSVTPSADLNGSIAQLGEHLPYKQRVIGSSPIVPTNGPVVQLVRTLACHARGRGFESHPGRHTSTVQLHYPRGFSSFGRARPCQGRGGGFEPRNPLQQKRDPPFGGSLFCCRSIRGENP